MKEEKLGSNKKLRNGIIFVIIILIICICLLVFAFFFSKKSNTDVALSQDKWPTKYVKGEYTTDIAMSDGGPKLNYLGNDYFSRKANLALPLVGDFIQDAVLSDYTGSYNAKVYEIKDYPEDCILAVQYEGDENYYIFANSNYSPATLGEFMEDLNLKDIASFGYIYYSAPSTDENKTYDIIEFTNAYNDENYFNEIYAPTMRIYMDIPFLGYEEAEISVRPNGYITTGLFGTSKIFYIGEDNVQKFVDYIVDNYQGYKLVYVYPEEEELDETTNSTIMMLTNSTNEAFVVDMNLISSSGNSTTGSIK